MSVEKAPEKPTVFERFSDFIRRVTSVMCHQCKYEGGHSCCQK